MLATGDPDKKAVLWYKDPLAMKSTSIIIDVCFSPSAGSSFGEGSCVDEVPAIDVAKECFFAALKTNPKSSCMLSNFANAYYVNWRS